MAPIDWTPGRKTLGEFSEAGLFALGMVACPLACLRGRYRLAAACWALAVAIRLVGLARPGWLRPAYLGLALASWPVGWIVSRVALGLLYFLVFTPVALAFRLAGRDALRREPDRDSETYWEPYDPDRGPERYLRPF